MDTMTSDLFRRIQYKGSNDVSFGDLSSLMYQFAQQIPFENISVIKNENIDINRENLIRKIINQQRGGLCYELNKRLMGICLSS